MHGLLSAGEDTVRPMPASYVKISASKPMHTGEARGVDLSLIERIAARDESAVGEFYDRHSRLVFGLILRILRNRSEAEEVLQEVFVQAWRKVGTYNASLGAPVAWLVRIARNRAIDRLRSNHVRERTTEAMGPDSGDGRGEAYAPRSEEQIAVVRALASLPAEQRVLIEYAYFEGLTHGELAKHFSLPLGTVKTRVRSGLAALRRELSSTVHPVPAGSRLS